MTLNMGTAAYMAPETSSISGFARDFSRSTDEIRIARDVNIDTSEKERLLAQNHATAVNAVDLSCGPHSSFAASVASDNAAQTHTKLAPKVGMDESRCRRAAHEACARTHSSHFLPSFV